MGGVYPKGGIMFTRRRGFVSFAFLSLGIVFVALLTSLPQVASSVSSSYFSCPLSSFFPDNSASGYLSRTPAGSNSAFGDYRNLSSQFGGNLLCSLNLPHGSQIKNVTYDFYSNTDTGLPVSVDCYLKRLQLDVLGSAPTATNITSALNIRVLGRTQWTSQVNLNDAKVDNQLFSYYLSCSFPANNIDAGLVGAVVEYQ